MPGLFVTGTDTNVGKTVACAGLLHRYGSLGSLGYWKPIQTGIEQDDDTAEVQRLVGCNVAAGVRLACPVSPHLAARRAGRTIGLQDLRLPSSEPGTAWIVEGAGGVLVPLNDDELMIDFMRALELPVLVVTRSGVGTINHTLLTLEALRIRLLRVAGVLMIGEPNSDNRAAIEHYGRVAVLGEMPRFEPLERGALAEWARSELDRDGCLMEFLT